MKAKVIKSVLRKKIDSWLASIEDEAVRKAAKKDTIVTGGCIASMLLKEQVNDFDVYFKTRDTAIAIANYYVNRFKPKNAAGIACKMYVDESKPDRVRVVVKSAGIASEEAQRQQADVKINKMKSDGTLARRASEKALADQVKWGGVA